MPEIIRLISASGPNQVNKVNNASHCPLSDWAHYGQSLEVRPVLINTMCYLLSNSVYRGRFKRFGEISGFRKRERYQPIIKAN